MHYSLFMPITTSRYEVLPAQKLWPTRPVPNVPPEVQAERMTELRLLHNTVPNGYIRRDRELQRLALSNSLSRQDMAIAIGVHKSRVDQIIRDLTLLDDARKTREAIERIRPHMPDELFKHMLRENPAMAEQARLMYGDEYLPSDS